MKLQILGTAACEGIPAAFCNCKVCVNSRKEGGKALRTRSQVLVDDDILIDLPPETYSHSIKYGFNLANINNLLITHSHCDHFYPFELFNRGGEYSCHTVSKILNIYSSESVKQCFYKLTNCSEESPMMKLIKWNIVSDYETFECGNKRVTPLPAKHMENENSFIYLIQEGDKAIFYATDASTIDEGIFQFFANNKIKINVVVLDCTRGGNIMDVGRHMNAKLNQQFILQMKNKGFVDCNTRFIATHFSHNGLWTYNQAKTELKKLGIESAYDGMKINI